MEEKDQGYADIVNHPAHYTQHKSGVECIQITEEMGFCLGNAIKYIWRADLKGGTEDLEKAIWYLRREMQRREKVMLTEGVCTRPDLGEIEEGKMAQSKKEDNNCANWFVDPH